MTEPTPSPQHPSDEVPQPRIGIIGKVSVVMVVLFVVAWPLSIIYLNIKQRTHVEHDLAEGLRAHYEAWQKGVEIQPNGAISPADLIALGFITQKDYDRHLRHYEKAREEYSALRENTTQPATDSTAASIAPVTSTQPGKMVDIDLSKIILPPPVFSYGDYVFCYVGIKPGSETNQDRVFGFSRKMHGSESGRFVLFGNGEVKWLPKSKFNATIQSENNLRAKAGLPEIHYQATKW